MGAWDAVKYGWNVVYWVTIEGIPAIFTERGLGLTLPSGYEVEDASLVIDDSSQVGTEVDRRRGLGAGLSLGFRLLDTATVRGYVRRPQYVAALSQDENATTNTIHVETTTGWPNAGRFWLGHELITYTGKTAATFTGCTRGVVGLAYKHALVSAGNLATSSPRWWRGRTVTLWASPVNQAGLPSGSALTTDAVQVWRGKMSDGPNRGMAWWDFQADSLERLLDRPLAAKLSGKVVPTATVYAPPTSMVIQYQVTARDNTFAVAWTYSIEFSPFAGSAPATLLTGEQMRKRIADEFQAAVAAAGFPAKVLGLKWTPHPGSIEKAGKILPGWGLGVEMAADAAVYWLRTDFSFTSPSNNFVPSVAPAIFPGGMPQVTVGTGLISGDNPVAPQTAVTSLLDSITVQLDSGLDALVPTKGLLRVVPTVETVEPFVAAYKSKSLGPAGVVFSQLSPGSTKFGLVTTQPELLMGATVEVIFADDGAPDQTALRLLHSSGTGLRSVAYDMLGEGSGYGLSSAWVDSDTFASLLGAGSIGQLALRISPAGASFADIFAGLLAVARLAVATRTVDGATKLACVRTDAAGAEYYQTIADVDLLSVGGDPVDQQARLNPLNVITIKRAPYGLTWGPTGKISGSDEGDEDTSIFSDIPAVLAMGEESLEATVPALDNDQLTQLAFPLALATFAGDQALQAISLSVPPWVSAQVGDLVRLELTHPSLWDYEAQTPGYTGPGRIVGRTIELRTLRVKLTVLINSGITTKSLAPAARVLSWTGPANNPATIDVGLQYLAHFQQAVAGGSAWVLHYKPGQTEVTTAKFGVSAVAKVGGNCRLTIIGGSWNGGTLATSESSTLTVPSTADANTFQRLYTHAGDGSTWS